MLYGPNNLWRGPPLWWSCIFLGATELLVCHKHSILVQTQGETVETKTVRTAVPQAKESP